MLCNRAQVLWAVAREPAKPGDAALAKSWGR